MKIEFDTIEEFQSLIEYLGSLKTDETVTKKRAMTGAERVAKCRANKKTLQETEENVTETLQDDDAKESTKENILINNTPNNLNIFSQEEFNLTPEDVKDLNITEELKEKEKEKEREKEKRNGKKSENKKKFGQFRNVLLTDEELLNFQNKFPDTWKSKIEDMSLAIASKGYTYKSHYAALLSWARKEGDYTFESRKGERAFKKAQEQKPIDYAEFGRMMDQAEAKGQVIDL